MKQTKIASNLFSYIMVLALIVLNVNAAQPAVDLGTAGNFVILTKSGISTTGTTSIVGNVGVSPIDSTAITGFGLIIDSSNEFATSSIVTGKLYAANYAPPTPSVMTTAISDMETAYTDAAGRTLPGFTELGAGNIGGMTLAPGLYKWGTGVTIPTDVTLSGDSDDVWIFQIAQDLDISSGKQVILIGGAQAKNIFWQVAGQTTLGTTSVFNGNILDQTAIVLNTGARLNGRALVQTAATLDANVVSLPAELIAAGPGSTGRDSNSDDEDKEVGKDKDEAVTTGQPGAAIKTDSSKNKDASVEKEENKENNNGIGQELSEKIKERKEEIKSGDYKGPLGQLLSVKELSQDLKELRVNDFSAQTDLNITAETDSGGKTKLKIYLKNGQEIELKIMPDTASENALKMLMLKACSSDKNCKIQLKYVGSGKTEKVQYEMQLERPSRVLGLFQKSMHVSADIDAETGDTKVHKPWWAFIATEPSE